MKCSDAQEKLSALLDRACEPELRDALARHVACCQTCRISLETLSGSDQLVQSALASAAEAAPPDGYFEGLWPRVEQKLARGAEREDAMSMSMSHEDKDKGAGLEAPPSSGEASTGLHDIKKLARTTLERRAITAPPVPAEDDLLETSSPASLGQVVLPKPTAERKTVVDAPPPARSRSSAWLLMAGLLVAGAAAAAVTLFLQRSGPDAVATAPAAQAPAVPGAAPAAPPPAPPAPADPAGGLVPAGDREDEGEGDAEARPAESEPEAEETKLARAANRGGDDEARNRGRREGEPRRADTGKDTADKTAAKGDTKPVKEEEKAEEPRKEASDLEALLAETVGVTDEPKEEAKPNKAVSADEHLPDQLTRSDIRNGMRAIRARVQACYDTYKEPGTVTIKLRIGNDGTVTSAEAVDPKFRTSETGLCVAQAVQFATFPKFKGTPMTLNYPFRLE